MEYADYLHLVRVSEIDAEDNPKAYRRHVMLFAALGYGYALISVLISAALVWVAVLSWDFHQPFQALALGSAGAALAWLSLRGLVKRPAPIDGVAVKRHEAPELYRLLDKLQSKVGGPRIHRVVVTRDYNAFIQQTPRFGIFGPRDNTLGLGLPMLLVLSPRRLIAVLAHEYAHLRGGAGHMSTWLYRTRRNWERLAEPKRSPSKRESGGLALITQGFVKWYAPRFAAKAFALARQEEYDADALSARICGPQHTAAALVEMRVKADHMTRGMWQTYWRQAATTEEPTEKPYAWACSGRHGGPDPAQLERCLSQLRAEPARHDDTHPATRDRFVALGQYLQLPAPSSKRSTSILGTGLTKAIEAFDRQWWMANQSRWAHAHRCGRRDLAKVADMKTRLRSLSATELMRLGELVGRLGTEAQALPAFREALRKDPSLGKARWRVALEACERNDGAALAELRTLALEHPHFGLAATEEALSLIDRLAPEDSRRQQRQGWKELRQKHLELESRASAALPASQWMRGLRAHDLSADEISDLDDSARLSPRISRLWVTLRPVSLFPDRRIFVVFVEQAATKALAPIPLDTVEQLLDLPGKVLAVHASWLNSSEAISIKPPVGQPVYTAANSPT